MKGHSCPYTWKIVSLGAIPYFHIGFFVISKIIKDKLVFLGWLINIKIEKGANTWWPRANMWKALMFLGKGVWRLLVVKHAFLLYYWKRCCVFFLLVWHVLALAYRFVIGDPFFPLSSPKKCKYAFFYFDILTSVLIFFVF